MKKRNDPYEGKRRAALGLEQEREALSFINTFMGKSPEQTHVFGLTGDSGALRWLTFGCLVTRLEAPNSVLRMHCKQRGLQFVPPIEYNNVKMVRGNYYEKSGLEHIRRERFNMFDADSESGPAVQLRMIAPAIKSAMRRGHGLVVRNNMYGWDRGGAGGSMTLIEKQKFVQKYKYMLPNHVSINRNELDDKPRLNTAAFFIQVAQLANREGGTITFHNRGFYKPEKVGRDSPTVMCPSIFGIKPR